MDIQIIIALATVAVSAGIAWGVSQNRLKVHETRITAIESSYKIDHDVVNRHDDFVALTKTDHDIVSKLDDFITTARADHDVLIKHDDFITTVRADHDMLIEIKTILKESRISEVNDRLTRIETSLGSLENRMERVESKLGL